MLDAEITRSDIRHLRYAEHLMIWLLRVARSCPSQCRMVLKEFHHAFGALADEATEAIEALFVAMSKGRRALELARPGEAVLSHDEMAMLALFAAAQADDEDGFHARARFILGHDHTGPLWQAASRLTAVLTLRGYGLRGVAEMREVVTRPVDYDADAAPSHPVALAKVRADRAARTSRQA